MNNIMSQLFDFNSSTYYRWKKEKRPIINLLEKYFLKSDLEEFLETGRILKFEENKLYYSLFGDIDYDYVDYILHEKHGLKSYFYLLAHADNASSLLQFRSEIFELYKKDLLSDLDVRVYLEDQTFSQTLTAYINANLQNNWSIFYNCEVEDYYKILHKIKIYAAQENIYEDLFDFGNGYNLIPLPPVHYHHTSTEAVKEIYYQLLTIIDERLRDKTFDFQNAPLVDSVYFEKNDVFDKFLEYYGLAVT